MKFDINNYEGKYAMHCKTEEEARDFCNYLHSIGRKWNGNYNYLNHTYWSTWRENTVYYFNDDMYGEYQYALKDNYTVLEWEDFMNKEFTKADLKTGDVVLRRNGDVEIVNRELEMLIRESGWNDLDDIREDLTSGFGNKNGDIVAVRRPTYKGHCSFGAFKGNYGILVYEREEVEEMTLEQVCKLLGKNIKIIQ